MEQRVPPVRSDFRHFVSLQTRWMDNDIYGHINNVVFYSYFDTVINRYLIEEGGLDIDSGPVIGLAAESQCLFYQQLAFPDPIEAGLAVGHLGTSSVRYQIGLFAAGADAAAASGHFVHVFVDRDTRRPAPVPEPLRQALERLI